MTTKQNEILFKKLRALVSFRKIHTIQEVFNLLDIKFLEDFNPTQPIDVSTLNKIIHVYLHPSPKFYTNSIDCFEVVAKDSLIESNYIHIPKERWQDYTYPTLNPKQRCDFSPVNGIELEFQLRAAKEIYYNLFGPPNLRAALFRGNTGDGKTFTLGQIVRWIHDSKWLDGKSLSPFKIIYVTAASVVEKTKEELEEFFDLKSPRDLTITNYDALRSSFGEMMLTEQTVVREGYEHTEYLFKDFLHPIVFIYDECQKMKNKQSQQTKIGKAATRIQDPNVKFIYASATPFSRVSSAEVFALATRKLTKTWLSSEPQPLTEELWPTYSKTIASPGVPEEYTKVNLKRFIKEFKPYIFTFKNVKRKFPPINNVLPLEFPNKESKERYNKALETYLERIAKIRARDDLAYAAMYELAQLTIFRKASDMEKVPLISKLMWQDWMSGLAPVFACAYKPPLARIVLQLTQDYNIPRNKISIIWGGNQAWGKKEDLYTTEQILSIMEDALAGKPVTKKQLSNIKNQLQAKADNLDDIPEGLKLGNQTKEQRWDEIQRFQKGESELCLFTFSAGGTGLSLHQNKLKLRQRRTRASTTYNEMEVIQFYGRTDRITSLSSTEQSIMPFKDTIEQSVLGIMLSKMSGLNVIMKHGTANDIYEKEAQELLKRQSREGKENFSDEEDEDEGEAEWKEED